jgi:uncharacterized protein YihD (DUF1040 family)
MVTVTTAEDRNGRLIAVEYLLSIAQKHGINRALKDLPKHVLVRKRCMDLPACRELLLQLGNTLP